jgi:hypothetical protein
MLQPWAQSKKRRWRLRERSVPVTPKALTNFSPGLVSTLGLESSPRQMLKALATWSRLTQELLVAKLREY